MTAYGVDPVRWAFKLAPQLTGRVQQAYAALPASEAGDYEQLKKLILRRYDISEETYRQRFQAAKKSEGESYRELVVRLSDLEQKWTRECSSMQEIRDLIMREQLLNSLPSDLRVWVTERKPKTAMEAGELADDYLQARKTAPKEGKEQTRGGDRRFSYAGLRRCNNCRFVGHLAKDCRRAAVSQNKPAAAGQSSDGPAGQTRMNAYTPGTTTTKPRATKML